MSNVIPFTPKSSKDAHANLAAFIQWAQTLARDAAAQPESTEKKLNGGFEWASNSWHRYGVEGATFTGWESPRTRTEANKVYLKPEMMDFAKAVVAYLTLFQSKGSTVARYLQALRALEHAMVNNPSHTRLDITQITEADCEDACVLLAERYTRGDTAYFISKCLQGFVDLMRDKKLMAKPFRWRSSLRPSGAPTLKQQKAAAEQKLPNPESLQKLGELFNYEPNRLIDLDKVTLSAVFLLGSAPSRIGELTDIEQDCLVFRDEDGTAHPEDDEAGRRSMHLRWYAEKKKEMVLKPVFSDRKPIVYRVLEWMLPLTQEAREYAAWLEDNPDTFPPHKTLPNVDPNTPLTYQQVCDALKIAVPGGEAPRARFKHDFLKKVKVDTSPAAAKIKETILNNWDANPKRVYVNGRLNHYTYTDAPITLHDLNVLMRAKYLPPHFPYTTPAQEGKARSKYRDALFTVRTGSLPDETANSRGIARDFGVEIAAHSGRIGTQLRGGTNGVQSIFERHGRPELALRSHQLRHLLNTEMHEAGLAQTYIDLISGRNSLGHVYDHVSVDARTSQALSVSSQGGAAGDAERARKIETNAPLTLKDVTHLENSSYDRVLHSTEYGVCVHDFAGEPCPKMGACLTCGNLACIKGDAIKLDNLKAERKSLVDKFEKAKAAVESEVFGAERWYNNAAEKLLKCDALIKLLESPELHDGAIVWNADDGWTLATNAAVMSGLMDTEMVEGPKAEQAALPSLDDMELMIAEIEG